MITKLEELRYDAEIARQVTIESMDRRSIYAPEMSNLYFKALHAYRVELRRVRMKEKIVMQAGQYQASDYNDGLTDWECGPYLTRPREN